jgi:tryptophan-rich sensory protein
MVKKNASSINVQKWMVVLAVAVVANGVSYMMARQCPMTGASEIKAAGEPAPWVFGVVWALLYSLLACTCVDAAYVYERTRSPTALAAVISGALFFVACQAWVYLYSDACRGQKKEALHLLLAIHAFALSHLLTVFALNPLHALLVVPAVVWVNFATTMNNETNARRVMGGPAFPPGTPAAARA